MFGGKGSQSSQNNEDEDYDFDFNIDVGNAKMPGTACLPGTAFRPIGTAMATSFQANIGRMQTGGEKGNRGYTAAGGEEARPMTAVTGAGYQSSQNGRSFDPMKQSRATTPKLAEKSENGVEHAAKEIEKQVHKLIEDSSRFCVERNFLKSLETAKEAGKKERQLVKHRDSNGLSDQQNADLTYATWFSLAVSYERNEMYEEAINTYMFLVKKKQYPASGRLRVNLGNIYFLQQKYQLAIKMYRMALDQIPDSGKEMGYKICQNIGKSFVKLGQYRDAIQSFETVMGAAPNFQVGLNLIICYYALGDPSKMKRCFSKLVAIPCDKKNEDESEDEKENELIVDRKTDDLEEVLKKRKKDSENYILKAARLIAPVLDKSEWINGYRWVCDQLQNDFENIACEMEIDLALQHLKRKEFDSAIKILKSFEKKDVNVKAMAATNLSSIYFLERDYKQANMFADLAVQHSRYNAKALVNKGNCLFMESDYGRAKELFLEAIGVQADCVEAIYNLGLTNTRMSLPDQARQAFEKLHSIIPNNPAVIYQIANIHEQQDQIDEAMKWFNILINFIPTDPGILSRIGHILSKENDESQGFHYQLESYRSYPVNLDVISWLGVWFVKHEMYEKSIHLFERASQIQPNEVKWQLMVTSCYRRMGNYNKALDLYQQIHNDHPENIECLRYLIAICKDLAHPYEKYQEKLARLDRQDAGLTQPPAASNVASEKGPSKGPTSFWTRGIKKEGQIETPRQNNYDEAIRGNLDQERKIDENSEREEEDFADTDVNELLV